MFRCYDRAYAYLGEDKLSCLTGSAKLFGQPIISCKRGITARRSRGYMRGLEDRQLCAKLCAHNRIIQGSLLEPSETVS